MSLVTRCHLALVSDYLKFFSALGIPPLDPSPEGNSESNVLPRYPRQRIYRSFGARVTEDLSGEG